MWVLQKWIQPEKVQRDLPQAFAGKGTAGKQWSSEINISETECGLAQKNLDLDLTSQRWKGRFWELEVYIISVMSVNASPATASRRVDLERQALLDSSEQLHCVLWKFWLITLHYASKLSSQWRRSSPSLVSTENNTIMSCICCCVIRYKGHLWAVTTDGWSSDDHQTAMVTLTFSISVTCNVNSNLPCCAELRVGRDMLLLHYLK